MEYIIYTDGAYKPSKKQGGYSVIIQDTDQNLVSIRFKGVKYTTNNRMEISGVLSALEFLSEDSSATIYSDSEYVIKTCTLGWLDKWKATNWEGKKNVDLWKRVDELLKTRNVTFKWVKGHASSALNNLADLVAQHAAEIELS